MIAVGIALLAHLWAAQGELNRLSDHELTSGASIQVDYLDHECD